MPLNSIQQYHGENFAPIEPLTDAKKTAKEGGSSSMSAFFREIYQEIQRADIEAWHETIQMGEVISNLRSGKLIFKRDMRGNGFTFHNPIPQNGRDRSNYPVFPQISEDLKAKWSKAQPSVIARHFGDGYKTEIALKTVNTVVNSYFKEIFTPQYELQEALSAQDYGTYITRFYYDDRLNQIRKLAPILQNKNKVVMDGYGACYSCDFEGKPEDFKTDAPLPQCPSCGSFKTTKMLDPMMAEESEITDVEEIVQGDITGHLLDFPACKYDCRVLAHESSYFLYKQMIPLRLARTMFGDINIDAGWDSQNDLGLQVMESLATRGGNIEGYGASNIYGSSTFTGDKAVMEEMWLKPEWYAGFKLDHAEKTVGGNIPAGVPFEELFPEGLCVVGFNEMNLQVGVYAEKSNIVSSVYYIQSFSGIGKGLSDGVDLAKDLSEIHSMAMAGLKRYGAAGVLFKKDAISPAEVRDIFNPRKAVPVNVPAGDSIRDMVTQVQFSPVNAVLPQYAVQISNLLNLVNLSGDFSEGTLQSVDINTLGGQQLATAKEEGKKGAILSMKVFHRQKSAEILTELFRQFIKIPKYYAANSDRHSASKGKWVSGADLPENIRFDAVPDSELPSNTFEKRQSTQAMVEKAGGIMALGQMVQADPKLTAWYAEQFGAELPSVNQDEIWLVCLSRIESIKENAEYFQDPEEILANLSKPLAVRETGHLLKAEFISQVLDDDEVATWNPVAVAAVQLLIERHYELQSQAMMQDELIKQRATMQLQMQAQQMQQEMMQPQIDAQNQANQQAVVQQAVGDLASRVIDDEQKGIDHERQLGAKEADHARTMELEEMRAKAAKGKK